MPKPGDKLYAYWNGKDLEIVTFVEESIVDGATVPTYLLRDSGGHCFRTSRDLYKTTELEATREFVNDCREGLDNTLRMIEENRRHLNQLKAALNTANRRIAALTSGQSDV